MLIRQIIDYAEELARREAGDVGGGAAGSPVRLSLLQVMRAHDAVLAQHTPPSWVQQGGYYRLFLKMALDPEPSWPLKAARMEQRMEQKRTANWIAARRLLHGALTSWMALCSATAPLLAAARDAAEGSGPTTPDQPPRRRHVTFRSPVARTLSTARSPSDDDIGGRSAAAPALTASTSPAMAGPLADRAALEPPEAGDVDAAHLLSDESFRILQSWFDSHENELTRHTDDTADGAAFGSLMLGDLDDLEQQQVSVASSGDLRLSELGDQRGALDPVVWGAEVTRRCLQLWRGWAKDRQQARAALYQQWLEAAYYWANHRQRVAFRWWREAFERRRQRHEGRADGTAVARTIPKPTWRRTLPVVNPDAEDVDVDADLLALRYRAWTLARRAFSHWHAWSATLCTVVGLCLGDNSRMYWCRRGRCILIVWRHDGARWRGRWACGRSGRCEARSRGGAKVSQTGSNWLDGRLRLTLWTWRSVALRYV